MPPVNQHRRAEDDSWSAWIRDKVLPPLIVAFIVGAAGGGLAVYKKLDQVAFAVDTQAAKSAAIEARLAQVEADLTVTRSQMVGWDVLKRIEQSLQLVAQAGKGDKAMAGVAASMRSEIEARKEAGK